MTILATIGLGANLNDPAAQVDWGGAEATPVRDADLERVPAEDDAFFGLVPATTCVP